MLPTTQARLSLEDLNGIDPAGFTAALGTVFEDAPWVAAQAAGHRPFATVTALHQTLFDQVMAAPEAGQLAFLNGHPDLAGTAARQRSMGEHSTAEQAALGLDRLDEAGFARFTALNDAYRARFGMPFLICVRRHTLGSILRNFARRLNADPASERAAALQEVFFITRLRVAALVQGPGMPRVAGSLSTHVLDSTAGRPGAGIAVEIMEIDETGSTPCGRGVTDADGRVTLLDDGGPLRIGSYELRFHLGDHFAGPVTEDRTDEPPFLDVVPVRIGVALPETRHHVPLLAGPFGYTVYRGG